MKNTHIRIIVLFGAIAITGIIVFQLYWFNKTWDLNEKELNQSIQIALRNVVEDMCDYHQIDPPAENPVSQLSPNYYIVDAKTDINSNILEFYLAREFEKHNIDLDYEYGIYDCHSEKMIYGKYVTNDTLSEPKTLLTDLPVYKEYVYYFGVNFPTRQRYLISELSIWTALSSILLIVIVFFVYTLFIILKQKRLSEQQKEFINNMTHEFKTPISSINISADTILNKSIIDSPERLETYGKIIKQENERLNRLVERVLNLAHIEKKGFSLEKESIDLHELIHQVLHNVDFNRKDKAVEFKIETKVETAIIEADKLHLSNIIFNLIDNAIKYSFEKVSIEVKTRMENQYIVLTVADNGIGMSKEAVKKVFQKFYRVPTGNLHDVKGFGLGLYYVKTICKKHNWQINVDSQLGKGSKFNIFIPLKK